MDIQNHLVIKLLMKKNQNLSIIIDAFSRGGAQKVLQLLIPEFLNKYKSVTIFLIQNNKNEMQLDNLQKLGLKIYRLEARNILDFRAFIKFLVLITKSKPSQIQAHLYWSQIWSIFARILLPKAQIYWVEHNTYLNRTLLQWKLYKFLSNFSSKIIVVSNEIDVFLKKKGIRENVVIFNPISSNFTNVKKDLAKPQFLFVGRLNEQKNPLLLLDSFNHAILNNLIPGSSKLSICGEGVLHKTLFEKSNLLPYKEQITFHGFLEEADLITQYQNSMVFVSTSIFEGFPLARAEALASGCVVVTTKTGGIEGFLNSDEDMGMNNGIFIVDPDIESIALGMSEAISPSLWNYNSINYRVGLAGNLSPSKIAELYFNLDVKSKF